MSPELSARLEALKARFYDTEQFKIFTTEDAATAEKLRTDMLAFIRDPSFRLGRKVMSALTKLEQLAHKYPPSTPCFFAEVAGCYHSDYQMHFPDKDNFYYELLKECAVDLIRGSIFHQREPDCRLFYKRLSDPRRPIRLDFNANFQVGNVLNLFEVFVLVLEDIHFVCERYEEIMYDGPPCSNCGKYLPLLDPDFYVRAVLPDLVAPEDQVPGRKYVKCYKDISKWVEDWTIDSFDWVYNRLLDKDYIRGVIAMPFSSLVPPGYGLPMFLRDGCVVLGSFVDDS